MKKGRNIVLVGCMLLLIFAGVSVFTFWRSNRLIEQGYLKAEGSAAENFALLAASNLHFTDADVERLKSLSYSELLESPENETLRQMMDNENFTNKVDYAYLMVHLPEEEVRFYVSEENQTLFGAAVGTPLDIMWLLDVNVSASAEETFDAFYDTPEGDISRYSCYVPIDDKIFNEAPTYIFNASSWGDHICGYAPLYTEEGNYVGVVGIELQTGDYNKYRNTAMVAMGALLGISTMTLFLGCVILYLNHRKQQMDKFYTDPLTGVCNRSYYNDQFIKYLNGKRGRDTKFALMIADIDWFKKVNDTFGHEVGDMVLIEMSGLLRDAFGKAHVVRFGGEEFVIGLWYKNEEELKGKLDALYETIRSRTFTGQEIGVTLSLGCSYCEADGVHGWLLSGMLRMADGLLYEAKENGRTHNRMAEFTEGEDELKAAGQPGWPASTKSKRARTK